MRGQLCLVCAGPGVGKSAFILSYALQARVPTMYFSADSDAFTQASRSVAMLTGWSVDRAATTVRGGDLGEAAGIFEDMPIRFAYSASPTLDEIEDHLKAYQQTYGALPHLIVIDNITNCDLESTQENASVSLEDLMDYLHKLARDTGAMVIGLHHVTGEFNDGDKPIPLSGVKNQIGRVPELIITLHRKKDLSELGPDTLYVSTVKNRSGKSDPSGQDAAELQFFGDSMGIKDFPMP